jgi:hypothetical protein
LLHRPAVADGHWLPSERGGRARPFVQAWASAEHGRYRFLRARSSVSARSPTCSATFLTGESGMVSTTTSVSETLQDDGPGSGRKLTDGVPLLRRCADRRIQGTHHQSEDLGYTRFTRWRRRWTAPANMSSARKTSDRLESASTDGPPHQDDDVSLVGAHTSPSNHSVRSMACHTT